MPHYDYKCESCLYEQEAFRSIERRFEAPPCDDCGSPTTLQISAPAIRPDSLDYYDEGLGQRVTSRAQRKAVMKSRDLEESGSTVRDKRGVIYSQPGQASWSAPGLARKDKYNG